MKAAPARRVHVHKCLFIHTYIYIYIYIYIYLYINIYINVYKYYILILVAFNFCFSEKLKHKKGRKEKVEKCSFVLYQHSCMMNVFFKNLKEVDNDFYL